VVVEFREPQQGLISGLRVRCLAPRPAAPAEWISPSLRLRQAVCRSETLKLAIHPDVQLERWMGGDFQWIGGATETDGTLTLSLVDARAAVGPPSTRPRCQLATGGADFTTTQETRWHVEPAATALTSAIAYHMARGRLHQLAVKLPVAGGPFHVDSVEVEPRELLQSWAVAGPLLLVDLQQGVTPRRDARLAIRLSSTLKPAADPRVLDVPDVEPLGPALRASKLAVTLDPRVHAQLLQASVPVVRETGPASAEAPAFAFAYHDQVLASKLRLYQQHTGIRAHSRQEVALGSDTGEWQAKVDIDPLLGHPAAVDVDFSAELLPGWQVKADVNPALIHYVERLPLWEALPHLLRLGAGSSVEAAALELCVPRAQWWRIHFTAPLTQKTTFALRGSFRAAGKGNARKIWHIPVLRLPGAEQEDAALVVRAGDQRIERALAHGLDGGSASGDGLPFRVDSAGRALPRLELHTSPGAAVPDQNALCESRELVTCVEADGTLTHRLRVRLRNWRQPQFVVIVPDDAQALAARIDGAWLDRLDAEPLADATQFTVPVNTTATVQEVELLYSTAANTRDWIVLRAVQAPLPRLPKAKEPLVASRYWRFPPGWIPCDASRWRPRGAPQGIRAQPALPALAGRAWHAADALVPGWDPSSSAWIESQRADLQQAEGRLRHQLAAGTTLGAALEGLAQGLKDTVPVTVDAEGLRRAGKAPATGLPPGSADRPFWEALDLVFELCPSGPLLTTPERVRQWRTEAGAYTPLGVMLDTGVAEAAAYGQDHAGCFRSVGQWLRSTGATASPGSTEATAFASHGDAVFGDVPARGWTEWEPVPGVEPDSALFLVHAPSCRWIGYGLAGLWLIVAVSAVWRLSAAAAFRVHVLAAGLLILALLWLPAPVCALIVIPVVLAELAVFAIMLTIRALPRRAVARPGKSTMVQVTASTLLCAVAAALPLAAQPAPEPQPVYLVAGHEPGQQFALVSPALVGKLDSLASRTPSVVADGVVVAANYQGQIQDGIGAFAARFELQHFAEQSTFILPLTGVQLQPGIFLDGAPVFPVAHKGGYALPLRGKGLHRLTLSFQARAVLINDHHELRFGMPRAGQCQLEVTAPAPLRTLSLVGGLGEARVEFDKKAGVTLRAQLGHETLTQVRWPAAASRTPAAIEVREAYAWDLRPATLGLTAGVQFTVTNGSLAQVHFALPEGLRVRQVEVAATPASPATLSAPALRQWEVIGKDASQQLVIDFTQAVAGSVTLAIEMVPRLALTPGPWLLRLPAPLVGTSTAGLLAYRLEGMDPVMSPQNLSVGAVMTPELLGESWARRAIPDPAAVTKIVNFRRMSPTAALGLIVQPARPTAALNLRWRIGERRADLSAQINVVSAVEELGLVELELPPRFKLLNLSATGGTHVHHWNRQDRLVQVWLQQPRKQVNLELGGRVEHAVPGPASRFNLAPVRVLNVRSIASTIALDAEAGLTLMPDRVQQLMPTTAKGDAHEFTSTAGDYAASFRLLPVPIVAVGRAFTLVERNGDAVDMTTTLHLPPQPGEVRVTVAGWTGRDLRLDVPMPVARKHHQHNGLEHAWTLDFPPGLPQSITITLRGELPVATPAQTCTLPTVHIEPIPLQDHWVGLDGVEPAVKGSLAFLSVPGLMPVPLDYPAPPPQTGPAVRIGKRAAREASLALRVPAVTAPSTTDILFAQQEASWSGAGWIHRLRLLAFARGRGELRIRLPDGALCRALRAGDRITVPAETDLAIPLPGAAGPREVLVYWSHGDGEPPTALRLDRPRVAGLADIPCRVWLPAADAARQLPADLAENAISDVLDEAAARMRLCQLWAEQQALAADLEQLQGRFQRDLAQARELIALLQRTHPTVKTAELSTRAQQLQDANQRLAEQGRYVTKAGVPWMNSSQSVGLPALENGVPLSLRSATTLPLLARIDEQHAWAGSATGLLLLILVLLLLLSYARRGVVLLSALWPEALIACAIIGIALDGWTPVAVGLLVAGAGLRLTWLIAIARRSLRGLFTQSAEPANDDPVPTPSPPA
jgi:hypothetical protein